MMMSRPVHRGAWHRLPINRQRSLLVPASDLHLQTGSPCAAAGIAAGVSTDYEGNTYGNPPAMGGLPLRGIQLRAQSRAQQSQMRTEHRSGAASTLNKGLSRRTAQPCPTARIHFQNGQQDRAASRPAVHQTGPRCRQQ
jgi:hypothetical protein